MSDQADVDKRMADMQHDLDVVRMRGVRCRSCMRAFRARQESWSGDPLVVRLQEEVRFCLYCGAGIIEGP